MTPWQPAGWMPRSSRPPTVEQVDAQGVVAVLGNRHPPLGLRTAVPGRADRIQPFARRVVSSQCQIFPLERSPSNRCAKSAQKGKKEMPVVASLSIHIVAERAPTMRRRRVAISETVTNLRHLGNHSAPRTTRSKP